MEVEGGEKVGIVGHTGARKTSLMVAHTVSLSCPQDPSKSMASMYQEWVFMIYKAGFP